MNALKFWYAHSWIMTRLYLKTLRCGRFKLLYFFTSLELFWFSWTQNVIVHTFILWKLQNSFKTKSKVSYIHIQNNHRNTSILIENGESMIWILPWISRPSVEVGQGVPSLHLIQGLVIIYFFHPGKAYRSSRTLVVVTIRVSR